MLLQNSFKLFAYVSVGRDYEYRIGRLEPEMRCQAIADRTFIALFNCCYTDKAAIEFTKATRRCKGCVSSVLKHNNQPTLKASDLRVEARDDWPSCSKIWVLCGNDVLIDLNDLLLGRLL